MKKNLGLKLFSVLMAVFLWSLISHGRGGDRMEISLGVPVELHNLPADMEIVRGPVERIDVRLAGPRRVVSRVSQLGLTVPLDMEGAAEGETTIEIFRSDLKVPENITVTRVSPSSVTIELEKTMVATVGVKPVVNGKPAQGYLAGDPSVAPERVRIKGPKSVVRGIRQVRTVAVDIEGITETMVLEVPVAAPSEGITLLDNATVTVTVPVKSATAGTTTGPQS